MTLAHFIRPFRLIARCTLFLAIGCFAPTAKSAEDFIAVGIQVFVYQNAIVTQAQADDVLARSNVVFTNAKANLNVRRVRYFNNEQPPNGVDSRLSEADRQKIYKKGLDGTAKRLALAFVEAPNVNNLNALGYCQENGPVCIIRLSEHTDALRRAGDTAAHEFCHAFGLDHINDKKNLMNEEASSDDPALSVDQVATVRKRAMPYHFPVKVKESKVAPATPKPKSSGMSYSPDSTNMAAPDYLNVTIASMASDDDNPVFDVRIALLGLMPTPGAQAIYRMFFDTDNNPGTGAVIAGHSGIDRVLRVDTFPSGLILYRCQDVAAGTFTPLSGARIDCVGHMDYTDPPIGVAEAHAFEFSVPKSLLNLTGGRFYQVPVSAQQGPIVQDEFEMSLDLSAELAGPQLSTLTGQIGPSTSSLTLLGSAFTPNAEIELAAGQTVVATTNSDANGEFSQTVTIPPCTPGNVLYLWAGETAIVNDAYTVVHRIPTACDADCNESVNSLDIAAFAQILLGTASPCSACAGDANADGLVDGRDVKKFVEYYLE